MSFLHVVGIRLKVGHHLLMNLCCWLVSIISMCWYSSGGGALGINPGSLCNGEKKWLNLKCWETISGERISRICKKAPKSWCRELLGTWVVVWFMLSLWIFCYMKSLHHEKRKETLGNMCDERARMLQDQFNVSMNHVQAMSILISTFHHGKNPSAIDQLTFARFTERTAFERPLMRGVAYAVRVVHSERERFEKEQGWTIKKMITFEQTPDHKHDYASEKLKSSPYQEEYAPVIFAQDTVSHVISVDMLSGKEDRENIFRARASGKGVLTAPFRLIKTNRLGVILTFAVYRTDLPYNAAPDERIQASLGYFGGIFDIESLVEKLLQQLASTQTLVVNVYDITNISHPISMYTSGSSSSSDVLEHVSRLNFGDPFRSHEMRCRFKQKPPWPLLAIITSMGVLVIALLVGQIFYATKNRITKVEDDYQEMMELKKRAEAADIAKSQFLATVSHEIRTPMNGVLGMLDMLMDTDLDVTQRDYVRTAQASGKALVSLINEVLDQARIEFGKLELEAVRFNLRAIMDDVLSLFSGKSQEKNIELAVYVSDRVPEILIGDPGRFRQIITNLMGNSIKFTEKGHIFVTVHLVEEVMNSKKVDTESLDKSTLSGLGVAERCCSWRDFKTLRREGPSYPFPVSDPIHLIVSVEDTGVGIPIEDQSRVFTPFMQMGPSVSRVGGTGIGLSISKCLVGLMNGDIGFVSKPKIGSTFTFTGVFSNGCTNFDDYEGQKINHQSDPASSDFMGMTALVVDPRAVRAMVSRYHIERLGIHVNIASDLNQYFSALCRGTSNTNKVVDMVFVEQEAWDDCLGFSALSVNKLTKLGGGVPPKLFILTNSVGSSGTRTPTSEVYSPTFIRKPLRASMLAASLQQTMGAGSKRKNHNGEVLTLSLSLLLRGRKILVVDDNRVNLRVAAGALKKYGADVVIASSGKEAISLLEPPHTFDACFMDIQMPEMDGFEATGKIRDTERNINLQIQCGEVSAEAYENVTNWHVPILAMTADVIQATHEKCLKSGMDGYVSKPFEAERLCREVLRFFQ